jgi:transcriptional regulator with GAF, ATPase, and Fis domain
MSSQVQEDLQGLQNALLNTDSVEQFLHELAVLSAQAMDDAMSCGMSLRQKGRPQPVTASSDPLASAADEVQYQTGDGPCLHALRHARPVRINDTAVSQQWPKFCRQAEELGIRSCYALPLMVDGEPVGALILYARQPAAFDPDETGRADSFAQDASGALTLALRMASCTDLNEQLRSSMGSRAVIDQALGVIMATEHVAQDRALALLKSISQNSNVRLRDLAASIVTRVSGKPPQPASPFEEDD